MSTHRKTWTESEKQEVLNYKKEHGTAKASRAFGVSTASIWNWEKQFSEGRKGSSRIQKTFQEQEIQRLLRENRELKAMVAEKELELRIKDSLLKKSQPRK